MSRKSMLWTQAPCGRRSRRSSFIVAGNSPVGTHCNTEFEKIKSNEASGNARSDARPPVP